MTKAEIIDAVYEKVGGFSKKEAAEIVEAVFDTMKDVLADDSVDEEGEFIGPKIKISGFGNFVVKEKKERVGRNPQTGAPIPISARRVLTFKPSQVLKQVLNPHKEKRKAELEETTESNGVRHPSKPSRALPDSGSLSIAGEGATEGAASAKRDGASSGEGSGFR